jgi:hypothetical protein
VSRIVQHTERGIAPSRRAFSGIATMRPRLTLDLQNAKRHPCQLCIGKACLRHFMCRGHLPTSAKCTTKQYVALGVAQPQVGSGQFVAIRGDGRLFQRMDMILSKINTLLRHLWAPGEDSDAVEKAENISMWAKGLISSFDTPIPTAMNSTNSI